MRARWPGVRASGLTSRWSAGKLRREPLVRPGGERSAWGCSRSYWMPCSRRGSSYGAPSLLSTRAEHGRLEALDFFELAPRRGATSNEVLEPADVASFAVTLRQMLAEQLPLEFEMATSSSRPNARGFTSTSTRSGAANYVLIVQAPISTVCCSPSRTRSTLNRRASSRRRFARWTAWPTIASSSRPGDARAPLPALCDIQLAVYAAVGRSSICAVNDLTLRSARPREAGGRPTPAEQNRARMNGREKGEPGPRVASRWG